MHIFKPELEPFLQTWLPSLFGGTVLFALSFTYAAKSLKFVPPFDLHWTR